MLFGLLMSVPVDSSNNIGEVARAGVPSGVATAAITSEWFCATTAKSAVGCAAPVARVLPVFAMPPGQCHSLIETACDVICENETLMSVNAVWTPGKNHID